jgi:hypothetical protein
MKLEDAQQAIMALNGYQITPNKMLQVSFKSQGRGGGGMGGGGAMGGGGMGGMGGGMGGVGMGGMGGGHYAHHGPPAY